MKTRKIKAGIVEKQKNLSSGFTFIEIIAVLLIVGILSAIAMEHSMNYEADLIGAVEVVKSHLRYAQIKAINSNRKWGIVFSPSTYTLEDETSVTGVLPGDIPQGFTFSSTINPIMFGSNGSPGQASATVNISKGGSSRSLIVTRNTGFIK